MKVTIIIIKGYIFATIISQNKSDKTKDTKVVGTDIKMITIVVQYFSKILFVTTISSISFFVNYFTCMSILLHNFVILKIYHTSNVFSNI